MKPLVWVVLGTAAMCGAPVWAQSAPKPAIKTESNTPAAPVPGKNSFTAGEATSCGEKADLEVTSDPVKDTDGVWYAEGRLTENNPVQVMVDQEGNLFESA